MSETVLTRSVTLHDVARQSGMSVTTVSVALTGRGRLSAKTRETVLRVANEMGYEANPFARGLRGSTSQEIGLFTLDLDLGVGTRKLQLIQSLLGERGYTVPIYAYGYRHNYEAGQQAKLMRALCRQRARAIICHSAGLLPEAVDELRRFQGDGGTVICDCYGQPLEIECEQVIFDEADNTYQAARHLLELGHRHIGLFVVGQAAPSGPRLEGFVRALDEFGLAPEPSWLLRSALHGDSEEDGVEAARQFLSLPPSNRPSALCIVNDQAATAFISVVSQAGLRIPQDVSVVGHDDRPVARFGAVPLSTISHPVEEVAKSLVDLLLARIEQEESSPPRRVFIRGELKQRQSTAAPNS